MKLRLSILAGLAASALALASNVSGAAFTAGNIVVVRIGDGTTTLGSAGFPVSLLEYTTSGSLVQTINLPTADAGAQKAIAMSGSATSDGALYLSADGNYLTLAGYNATPGTASVASAGGIARVVARISASGTVDTSTTITDGFTTNNVRGAVTNDGTAFWVAGAGSSGTGGTRYVTFGSSTSTQISTSVTNTRVIGIFGGQLYTTSASGAFLGVCSVGTGLPTTSGQTTTVLSGFPTSGSHSSYGFWFKDANTCYVADDGSSGNGGGIQVWAFGGSTWSLSATKAPSPFVSFRGICGRINGANTELYATDSATPSNVRKFDVTGDSFSTIVTAGSNYVFRGVAFTPGTVLPVEVDRFGVE